MDDDEDEDQDDEEGGDDDDDEHHGLMAIDDARPANASRFPLKGPLLLHIDEEIEALRAGMRTVTVILHCAFTCSDAPLAAWKHKTHV